LACGPLGENWLGALHGTDFWCPLHALSLEIDV
jgi:hypothetical protein